MIADIDIRLSFSEIFFPVKPVANKSQLAENPAPQPEKSVPDPSKTLSEKKGEDNAGQQEDHKYSEHEAHPDLVEKTQYRL